MFQASSVNAYSILSRRPYMDIFSEIEFMARNKFGIKIKESRTISPELFQEYLYTKNYYFIQVLDNSQKPLLKMTESDLPTGFDFIALYAINDKQTQAVAVIDGIIHDQIDVSEKPLLGILYHQRDGSNINKKWNRLVEIYDRLDLSYLENNLGGPITEVDPNKLLEVM